MEALISGIISFTLFHFASHPKSRFHKKLPKAKFKRIQLAPRMSIEAKNRIFHLHHWMLFVPILGASVFLGGGFLQSDILHGFLLGGIAQGLMYKDSLKFMHKAHDFHEKVSAASYHKFSFLKKIIN